MSMNWDLLQKSIDFMNMKVVINYIKEVALDTIIIPNLGWNPSHDRGEVATLPKRKRNNTPLPRPPRVSNIIHYDIAHSICTAIGGVRYVLVLIDKASTHIYEYGLKTLKPQSLLQAMKTFINDIGCKPSEMRADRDFKLIGGSISSYLKYPEIRDNKLHTTHVSGAPDGRRNKNGLIE